MATYSTDHVQGSAKRAVREGAPWIQRLARVGFAAKGLVYLIIGGLALRAALGRGGQATDSQGAMLTILQQPFGRALLVVVAVGLAGYATWRFVQAALDPEGTGADGNRLAKRAAYAISGALHAALALAAARMAMGVGRARGGDSGAQDWTALVLAQPLGRWIVAAVALGIVAFGLAELVRAYRTELPRQLDLSRLSPSARVWVVRFGGMGMAARGVVFALIGGFLVRAALAYDSSQARGLGGALESLHAQAHGPWLLGLVAVGLIAFGLFELVQARYRRIRAA
jgi:hypothetical protein